MFEIMFEALFVIRISLEGSHYEVVLTKTREVIKYIVGLLKFKDSRVLALALKCLELLLEAGKKKYVVDYEGYQNLLKEVEEVDGISLVESLQMHPNKAIFEQAQGIILDYFNCGEVKDMPSQFKFS